MKKIKLLTISVFLLVFAVMPIKEVEAGPFMEYYDCALNCIDSYGKWTIRRSLCAADCYVDFISSPVKLAIDAAT